MLDWLSTVHPEDRDRVEAYHENLLRGTGRGEAEFRIIWPDGSVHWIVSKARMYPDAAGEAAHVIGVNLDVTHLREAEQARRESEQRYSDLFRTMSQAVMLSGRRRRGALGQSGGRQTIRPPD